MCLFEEKKEAVKWVGREAIFAIDISSTEKTIRSLQIALPFANKCGGRLQENIVECLFDNSHKKEKRKTY